MFCSHMFCKQNWSKHSCIWYLSMKYQQTSFRCYTLRVTQEHSLAQQSSTWDGPGIIHWVTSFAFQYYSLLTNRISLHYYDTPQLPLQLYSLFQSVSLFHDRFISRWLCIRESVILHAVLTPSQPQSFSTFSQDWELHPHILSLLQLE